MELFLAVGIDEFMDQLAEDKLDEIFLKLSSASDIGEEVNTTTHSHDVDDVLSCIKAFIQVNNILMSSLLYYIVLMVCLLQRALIHHISLIDLFDGNELPN